MSVYLALYKGRPRKGDPLKVRLMYVADWLVRFFTQSQYSHCEIAIPDVSRQGIYHCYSASIRDKGVRDKWMRLPAERWDLMPVQAIPEQIEVFFKKTKGAKYDWTGVFRFLLPFIPQSKQRWFCSEWCAYAIGKYRDPSRYSPGTLAAALKETSK